MKADEWLADYRQRIDGIGARVAAAQRELADLTATASSEHGEVTATVDPAGALCRLSFGERAEELARPQLAQLVVDTVRRARDEAAQRSREAVASILGDHTADQVFAQFQAFGVRP